jgi:acyl-CoA synthetase (NDP forming)
MPPPIDFAAITRLMQQAVAEGRHFLYEFEVYTLLSSSGSETTPRTRFIPCGSRLSDEELTALPGDTYVLKIVSPTIVHKTEVGGVRIVDKSPNSIRSAMRRMLHEVPENYCRMVRQFPNTASPIQGTLEEDPLLNACREEVRGILQVQYMPPDSSAFGNELIVGLRRTREFGMIISAGLGGTDTELYAERFRKGQAVVAASTAMHDGPSFFQLFTQTIAYRKMAGLTRGQRRIVTDEQLIECFDSFIEMANHFSPANLNSPFVIEELEINPFAFTDFLMVPLDGLCRFSSNKTRSSRRPIRKIHRLLHPTSIGIIGVSATRRNFGRIILENIAAEGFSRENLVIIHEQEHHIDGIRCIPALAKLENKLDLFVVAINASRVPALIRDIVALDTAHSVLLIPGGMGETVDSRQRAEDVIATIHARHDQGDGGPVFLGANSMGVISRPGRYDTWFIPEAKLPKERGSSYRRAALISQSGAFMLNRSHQCPELRPAYMISMGNQTDLSLGDMLEYFKDSTEVDVLAVYAEGFQDLDGLRFCSAVRDAVSAGKEVVFYKAGRTPEGKAATSSHTASLAGDYVVCESCVRQAGAIVARNFTEFQDLFLLAEFLHDRRIGGNRLAAVSGAGFEAVGMADSIDSDDYSMQLARLSEHTEQVIRDILKDKGLASLVTLRNPFDITPTADDEAHALIARALIDDDGVDALVISLDPLSPSTSTLGGDNRSDYDMYASNSIRQLMIDLVRQTDKPIITVVDGGRMYNPLRDSLTDNGVPVFTTCDRAISALSLYIEGRLASRSLRSAPTVSSQGISGSDREKPEARK